MSNIDLEKLKYPTGPFKRPQSIDKDQIDQWISHIESFPNRLQNELNGLSAEQLNWIYRPDGWSIQQVVHHCADSHMNALTRFKLTLTEDNPTIKPYIESEWAKLSDTLHAPIALSTTLLEVLHARWVILLKQLTEKDYQKTFFHPEYQKSFRLDVNLALYAWHCNHHLGHVKQAKYYKGQF